MKQNNIIAITQTLQQHGLFSFTSRMLADLLGLKKVQTSQLLNRMEGAGVIRKIERGSYLLLGLAPEHVLSNPLYIGCNLLIPAYVSFWSALHYHGFTEQAPRTTFVATTRRKPSLEFNGMRFQFISMQPKAFFGYRREEHAGLPVVVADEEKTILDSLMFSEYAGGMAEVAKSFFRALERLNQETLIEYTEVLGSPSLGSRLGYLLEYFGKPTDGIIVSKGPINLDPQRPRGGSYQSRWRVYVNIPREDLIPEGIV